MSTGVPDDGEWPGSSASFRVEGVRGCAVVVASGEIDLSTSSALREALTTAAESSDRVVLDLTRVSFLDSTGMGVMVGALNQQRCREEEALCLVGPVAMVRRVLEITRLSDLFPIYPSVADAVERRT